MAVLVDSNVILDLMTQDERWLDWSTRTLAEIGDRERLLINPIIYGEVSVRFTHIEALEEPLPRSLLEREPIPYEAAFLAGKVFQRYRARGGQKTAPLPDLFIGAHAAVAGHGLITRDPRRYRVEFPKVRLIAP